MTAEGPAVELMRERVEIGVPVPTDIARGVLAELASLGALAAAVREWSDPAANDEDGRYTDAVYNALAALPAASPEETP